MIGNDVVDLKAAAVQSNWRRKGFLEKIFSAEEQELISSAPEPHQMVWLLWSMKEAAYKAHQREFLLPRKLNWRDYNCRITETSETAASGVVEIKKNSYFTASEINQDFVYTSAAKDHISAVKNDIFETSSEEMKRELLGLISEELKLPKKAFRIQKNTQGVPTITYLGGIITNLISFSGHGRFAAYSLSLMNCEMAVKHY